MTETDLKGVVAAIPTPFDASGQPDLQRFVKLAEHLLANGCDALNVCGTTGEATSMSLRQRQDVMQAASASLPKSKLMVGTGAAATADAVELTKTAAEMGFAGALLLPPFYYKGVSDDGIAAYLREVITATEASALPIYLYNFPALSGLTYTPELVGRLMDEFPGRIRGVKDSSGDMPYARALAGLKDGALDVFPSNEGTLSEARGGAFAGCISATATLSSPWCAAVFHKGDDAALETAVAMRKVLSTGALIPNIKSAAGGMMDDDAYARVRPPLVALNETEAAELAAKLATLTKA
ncbi:dihydrodipicolinate synthase family protein [Roseisalinus antarcticus]|uniref:4-hydroxy-tetrahydrodipicolinate synthase n=1 Tax=Roseisalinus antarcticus TaxID=254357 RepID=A0A1Y5TDR2_9RHOB|nr:dihydrodipicolinate synthase family protein [Roseisalinus antarcticus]SLN61283.1 4-hydroxy-tetrahydrodipicolinate synthase [Roseisalinus antarcticus]